MDIHEFENGWYGRMEDLVEELNDNGFDVLEATGEYIAVAAEQDEDGNDIQHVLFLGGTPSTIIVKSIETVTI